MPLPDDLHSLCAEIDKITGFDKKLAPDITSLADLGITFPGGPILAAVGELPQDTLPRLVGMLNTALLPLTPLFDLVDTLLIIKQVLDAVQTLNAYKIAKALAKLLPKIDKLLQLIPQVSIPLLLRDVFTVLIAFLKQLKAQLQAIVDQQTKLDLASARAAALGVDGIGLAACVACAADHLAAQLEGLKSQAAPLNRLLGLLDLLSQAAGLGPVPSLDGLGSSASDALSAIDVTISALEHARSLIPV